MDLKIEIDGKIMEATMKVVGDTMVVSPKTEKYEPTDGEIVTVTTKSDLSYTCFFKRYVKGCIYSYGGLSHSLNRFFDSDVVCCSRQLETIYPATEEEKKKLFDKLEEEGWEWKSDTKELVKLKWKPKIGEKYYRPTFCQAGFYVYDHIFDEVTKTTLNPYINKGWLFKTEKECKEFVDKLNQAIEGVKP